MARILIAEDDRSTAFLFRRILENREHVAYCVDSGERVMGVLDEFKPDLLVLDVEMPGISGFSVCERIRKIPDWHSLPVIFVSSCDKEEDILKGFDSGASDYILKPVRKAELVSKIELLIKRQHGLMRPTMASNTTFDSKYLVLQLLGQNDNCAVYKARPLSDSTPLLALKIFRKKGEDPLFLKRFLREAHCLERLSHPNIVKMIDYKNDRELYYLVMEFVEGRSLTSLIKERPLSEELTVCVGIEVVTALAHLDKNSMLHRDIKPDNIIIAHDGRPVIIDFGLAKEVTQDTLSIKDEMYGTPQYVSPEYIKGRDKLHIATDIYSLGVTFYYAITGRLPFSGDNHLTMFHKHLTEVPPPLLSVNSKISQEFSELVDLMLIKNPKARCGLPTLLETLERLRKAHDIPEGIEPLREKIRRIAYPANNK